MLNLSSLIANVVVLFLPGDGAVAVQAGLIVFCDAILATLLGSMSSAFLDTSILKSVVFCDV